MIGIQTHDCSICFEGNDARLGRPSGRNTGLCGAPAPLLACLVALGWIGYSAYGVVTREDPDAEQEVVTTEMDVTAITDYLTGLTEEASE